MFSCVFCSTENVPVRNSDVDYRLLEAAKAGDLDTVKVASRRSLFLTEGRLDPQSQEMFVVQFVRFYRRRRCCCCCYWRSFKCSRSGSDVLQTLVAGERRAASVIFTFE